MLGIKLQDPTKPYSTADLFQKLGISIPTPKGPSGAAEGNVNAGGNKPPTVLQRCGEGERNSYLCRLAGSLLRRGHRIEEALQICRDWNARNQPPLDLAEVEDTVARIAQMHSSENPPPPDEDASLEPLFDAALARVGTLIVTKPPPRAWLLNDCLPLGKVGAIVAPGGTGKSQFLLQLGAAVATGLPLAEHWPVGTQGAALLLFAEDDQDEIHRRLHSVVDQLSLLGPDVRSKLTDRLLVRSMVGEKNLITQSLPKGGVRSTPYIDRLILTCGQIPDLRLVVIDPATRFRGGSENAAEDTTRFVEELERLAQATGATVLVAQHTNKASGKDEHQAQTAIRGSSALTDGVRFQLNLAKLTPQRAKRHGLQDIELHRFLAAEVTKNNYAAPQPEAVLRRIEGGYLQSINASGVSLSLPNRIFDLIQNEAQRGETYSANAFEKKFGGEKGLLQAGMGSIRQTIQQLIKDNRLESVGSGRQTKLRPVSGAKTLPAHKLGAIAQQAGTKSDRPVLDGTSMLDGSTDPEKSDVENPLIGKNEANDFDVRCVEHRTMSLINQGSTLDGPLYIESRPSRGGLQENVEPEEDSASAAPPAAEEKPIDVPAKTLLVPELTFPELLRVAALRFGGLVSLDFQWEEFRALSASLNGPQSSDETRAEARRSIEGIPVYQHTLRVTGESLGWGHVFALSADSNSIRGTVNVLCGKRRVRELFCGGRPWY